MAIESLQSSIQRQNEYIDKKYKTANNMRKAVNAGAGAIVLGAGYLGAKSISKEKSALKDGIAGASDFVLKHTGNLVKKVDKKEKLTKVSDLIQKAKNAPAKNKALVVFGLFIGHAMLNLVRKNNYLKGVFNQAKADEKAVRATKAIEDEAVSIAERNKLVEESMELFEKHIFETPDAEAVIVMETDAADAASIADAEAEAEDMADIAEDSETPETEDCECCEETPEE